MRIAIVCQQGSMGGVRYALMLAKHLSELSSQVQLSLFVGKGMICGPEAHALVRAGVDIQVVTSCLSTKEGMVRPLKRYTNWRVLDRPLNVMREQVVSLANRVRLRRLAEQLDSHDLVHFAWPYGVDPPDLSAPMTFIPHDLIHSHEFGVAAYSRESWDSFHRTIARWLACATPIVSTHFVASELLRVFPDSPARPHVIYLANLNDVPRNGIRTIDAEDACARLGVTGEFILCANNIWPHKNLGLLISALWYLRQNNRAIRLVLVGPGTEGIRAVVNGPLYGDRVSDGEDCHVRGLGVVSQHDLLCLMRRAKIVVNPSLCEAGAGSALDAWALGCAVALSDIAAFRDQVSYLGTRACFFDPKDPRMAAAVLRSAIADPERRRSDGEASRLAMQRNSWERVARAYLSAFAQVADTRGR